MYKSRWAQKFLRRLLTTTKNCLMFLAVTLFLLVSSCHMTDFGGTGADFSPIEVPEGKSVICFYKLKQSFPLSSCQFRIKVDDIENVCLIENQGYFPYVTTPGKHLIFSNPGNSMMPYEFNIKVDIEPGRVCYIKYKAAISTEFDIKEVPPETALQELIGLKRFEYR